MGKIDKLVGKIVNVKRYTEDILDEEVRNNNQEAATYCRGKIEAFKEVLYLASKVEDEE